MPSPERAAAVTELLARARASGNRAQVYWCARALVGFPTALEQVERVIRYWSDETSCPDHWHCDPREAAHGCAVSRSGPCPACGEAPVDLMDASVIQAAALTWCALWRHIATRYPHLSEGEQIATLRVMKRDLDSSAGFALQRCERGATLPTVSR